MIAKLYICFGFTGLLSVVCWLSGAVVCVRYLRHHRRERAFAAALAAALAGWLVAGWHSSRVGSFRLDDSEQVRAAMEARRKQLALEDEAKRKGGEIVMRFAEDAAGEAVGETIMTLSELSPTPGDPNRAPALPSLTNAAAGGTSASAAVAASASTNDAAADYRSRGKQTRETGKVDDRVEKMGEEVTASETKEQGSGPLLKLPEYELSKRLNRINGMLADWVLYAVLAVLVGDYLRRFNRPLDPYFPLPIGGPWMELISPSRLLVNWTDADAATLETFLEGAVRKGQSFLYFGDRAGGRSAAIDRLRLRRWGMWPLPVLQWGSEGLPDDPHFLLDAVWFNRYAVVVPSARAPDTLAGLLPLLAERVACRATARRLPHLVWDAGALPEPAALRQLATLCREASIRLVIVGRPVPSALVDGMVSFSSAVPASLRRSWATPGRN